jgi:CubicO group peptidase (beta-lactamase class C family)
VPDKVATPPALARGWAAAAAGVVREAVDSGAFPGGVAVIGRGAGPWAVAAAGRLDAADATAPDTATVWDLASLTKVVATTTVLMRLVADGRVALDTPVVRYLPRFVGPGKDAVTVRHLLAHRGGLPAWRALYREAPTADSARALVFTTPLDTVPGVRYLYSDLGFILLGEVVHGVTGEPLDVAAERLVFARAGMSAARFRPPPPWRARVAPTEHDAWRGYQPRGEVHDENAVRLGGVSGHAGLFGTAADLARFARALLATARGAGPWAIPTSVFREFTRIDDARVSHRALGWETATAANSGGTRLVPPAFGHTGFTGTSLWVAPQDDLWIVLLTNRVNPTRENRRIAAVRVALADTVVGVLRAVAPGGSVRR